jgi:histidyl-tRNA synthetase
MTDSDNDMKISPVKGTRDFYPEDMAGRNFIIDGWRNVSLRHGFEEYDGPIFEHLELFTVKSGEEIVEQLFHLKDRAGRDLAIRPEITPTLARMINQRVNSLPRPIKWFSAPRLCRSERPQRGRLREFFQWNIDVVGTDDVLADAECIFVAVDYLREIGLGPEDVEVRINSRSLLSDLLIEQDYSEEFLPTIFTILDKRDKQPEDVFEKKVGEIAGDEQRKKWLLELGRAKGKEGFDTVRRLAGERAASIAHLEELEKIFDYLEKFGAADYCMFDMGIVRGLAYYTGPVFEIFDKGKELRAIAGGGRYDDLLQLLGGPKISGVGFGMGDVVLSDVLEARNLLPTDSRSLEFYLIDADPAYFPRVLELVGQLRRTGRNAEFSYARRSLSKQLKAASAANAGYAVIVGKETEEQNAVTVKTLATGEQIQLQLESLTSFGIR